MRITVLLLLTFCFFNLSKVYACGTMTNWIDAYYGKGPIDDAGRKMALIGIYRCGRNYPYDTDERLLSVLSDASMNANIIDSINYHGPLDTKQIYSLTGATSDLIEQIFLRFKCLPQVKESNNYQKLVRQHNLICPDQSTLQMRVNVSSRLNIRLTPEGQKIDSLKKGTIVHVLAQDEQWSKIYIPGYQKDDRERDTGYVATEFLAPLP